MFYTRVSLLLCLLLTACTWTTAAPPTAPPAPPVVAPAAPGPGQTAPPVAVATVAQPTAPSGDELALLDAARRQPRDKVALANALGTCRTQPGGCPLVSRTTPLEVTVGQVENFWVNDIVGNRNYEISATLRYAGPVVLMYVENGAEVNQAGLEQAARDFEQKIYPRTRALFGSEAQPGVDGDNRITVL
nr:hypothetical protein [Chloroflexaceae bacterium]